jgi:1-deoxy-D-xylulose 5-phosphate reductoisomerase
VLVDRFLKKEISWSAISSLLEKLLSKHQVVAAESLDTVLSVDREARKEAALV